MKLQIFLLLAVGLIFVNIANSQDRPPRNTPGKDKPSAKEMVKEEMKILKSEMDLSESQLTFIQKILEDTYKKVEENFTSKEKVMKLFEERDSNIKLLLSDEEWKKYVKIREIMDVKRNEPPPRDR